LSPKELNRQLLHIPQLDNPGQFSQIAQHLLTMGLFNIRTIFAITLLFALIAIAKAAIEQRATGPLNVAPIVAAIQKVTLTISQVLDVLDAINLGLGGTLVDLINALGNLANSVLALSVAIAVAIGQKAIGIVTSDLALLTTAVDGLVAAVKTLVTKITTNTVTSVLQADQNALALIKTVLGGLVIVLQASISALVTIVGVTSGTLNDDAVSLRILLGGLSSFLYGLV